MFKRINILPQQTMHVFDPVAHDAFPELSNGVVQAVHV